MLQYVYITFSLLCHFENMAMYHVPKYVLIENVVFTGWEGGGGFHFLVVRLGNFRRVAVIFGILSIFVTFRGSEQQPVPLSSRACC